ncbi:nucleoside-diphosphate kinase [Nocardia sp. NPDC050175]|uniref:nucleoside-diphosphate kinase n=1 Tax=Nocardia sp. NPDC050175 TaxID=3364317 RepID=UPI0037A9E724
MTATTDATPEIGSAAVLSTRLSGSAAKLRRYSEDVYFRESFEQLCAQTEDPTGFAYRHAILLCKPDAVLGHVLDQTVSWLTDNGFRIVAARRIRMTPHIVRAVWYFQWNAASPERRLLADLLGTLADALVLVVTRAGDARPVSVELTERKGPTDPERRRPGQLRYELGRYGYLLNLVHSTDEPADVIRELGIYFDRDERAELFRSASRGVDRADAAQRLIDELYFGTPRRSLRFEDAARAIEAQAREILAEGPPRLAAELRTSWATSAGDRTARLACFLRLAHRHRVSLDPWNVVVAGAAVFPMSEPGVKTLL